MSNILNSFVQTKIFKRKYEIIGHLVFLLLGIMAIVFAKERVFFSDSAYQVYTMVKDQTFSISVDRYSMYLSQLLPFFLIKLNAPLWLIVYSYSISFILIFYILWLIVTYKFKNEKVGILMLFTILGIATTFIHCLSELFQLMFYASFLFACIMYEPQIKNKIISTIVYYSLIFITTGLCFFIHPTAIFFIAFIFGFRFLEKKDKLSKTIAFAVIFIGWFIFKLTCYKEGNHDSHFYNDMKGFLDIFLSLFEQNKTHMYFKNIHNFYFIPLLLITISTVFYIKNKKYLKTFFIVGFSLIYWVIACVFYHNEVGRIEMERSFLPLFFFAGIPFLIDVFPKISLKKDTIFVGVFCFLLLFSFYKMGACLRKNRWRIAHCEEVIKFAQENNAKKLVVTADNASELGINNGWALSLETILLSSMYDPNGTVSIYKLDNDFDRNDEYLTDPNIYYFAEFWMYWPISEINKKYFNLPYEPTKELSIENGKMVIKEFITEN